MGCKNGYLKLCALRRSPSWKPSFLSHARTARSSPGTRPSLGAGTAAREEEEEEGEEEEERDDDEAEEEEALEDEDKEESILLDVGLEEHGDACRVGNYSVQE